MASASIEMKNTLALVAENNDIVSCAGAIFLLISSIIYVFKPVVALIA